MYKRRTVTLTPNPALDLWTTTAHVQPGPKLRCSPLKQDPGGGGINVSRVIRRLAGDTLALYHAGGFTGMALAHALEKEGVPALAVPSVAITRQSFSARDEMSGAVYRFVLPGEPAGPGEDRDMLDKLAGVAGEAGIVVGSGSLPPGFSDDFWAQAARVSKAAGAKFLLDSGDGVPEALAEGVDIYRENTSAIEHFEGRPVRWPDQAGEWARGVIARGAAEIVIVTEGERGALMVTREGSVILQPPQVEVSSAIGAGDSFVGAFCHALCRGDEPKEALRLAVATAAATLLTPGTELCEIGDIERLRPLVTEVDV